MPHGLRQHRVVSARGFTLLELIVVMTLLAVMASIAGPRLTGFMAGRDVKEDSRRMLSLVRWSRSEAISRGERMECWFNPDAAQYGARPPQTSDEADSDESAEDTDAPEEDETAVTGRAALQFKCDEGVTLHVDPAGLSEQGQAAIVFWPDGVLDEASPARIELWEGERPVLALVRNETGTDYRIEDLNGETGL